jgi:hypothetical protein
MVADWIKKAVVWNAFLIVIFVVTAGYFFIIGSPTFLRDAGLVIVGGYVSNAVYDRGKKIYPERTP